jgi:hypothetical protein
MSSIHSNIVRRASFCVLNNTQLMTSVLNEPKKLSTTALSQQLPFLLILPTNSTPLSKFWNSREAYCEPLSEWHITLLGGDLRLHAISNALHTSSEVILSPRDQPTTFRLNEVKKYRYVKPSLKSANIGYVACPLLIRLGSLKLPVQNIGSNR